MKHQQLCIDQFSNYGAYHTNTINRLIHVICVPLIVMSFEGIIHSTTVGWTSHKYFGLDFHWGWLFLLHTIVSILCDFLGGLSTLVMEIGLLCVAQSLSYYWRPVSLFYFITIQITAWIAQFIGHGKFENRRPALMDNLLQVFSAPFFVTMEVLFFLGYNPSLKQACERASKRKRVRSS